MGHDVIEDVAHKRRGGLGPYPPWSITASTRYCGLGFGPKATNQLFGSWFFWLEAVPVFPARFHEAGKP